MKRLRLLMPLLVLWLTLASCSYSFIYNQLDFILLQYADSMVSLDKPLYSRLKSSTKRLHRWHRQTQLPQYIIWLKTIRDSKQKHFTVSRIKQLNKGLNEFYAATMAQFFTELVELMPHMNHTELDELFESLHESNQDFYDDYVDISKQEREEKYEENMIESYETMLGDLNKRQLKIINVAVSQLIHTSRFRYKNRLKFQNSMRKVLYAEESIESKKNELHRLLKTTFNNYRLEPQQQHNSEAIQKTINKIIALADDKQHNHFKKELSEYITILKNLTTET